MASVYSVLPFDLHGHRFALPSQQAVRVLPALLAHPLPAAPSSVAGMCNVHGRLLPVFDLRRHLGWPAASPKRWDHWIWARTARRELVLPVDRCYPVSDISADLYPVDSLNIPAHALRGVLRSEDGLLLLQDIERFLSSTEEMQLTTALAEHARG